MRFLFWFLMIVGFNFPAFSQTRLKLSELKNHIGDSVTVEGKVKTIAHKDSSITSSTLITIGNISNSLTVVIENAIRNKFSVKPEDAYRNKLIRVSGRLQNNNGKVEIMINDPSQIVLVDHK